MLVPFKERGKEGSSFMTIGDLKQLDDSAGTANLESFNEIYPFADHAVIQ